MTALNEDEMTAKAILTTVRETLGGNFLGSVVRLLFCNAKAASEQSKLLAQLGDREIPIA